MPMALCSDATVTDGQIVGDPTEAALVVLAAKGGSMFRTRERRTQGSPKCRSTRPTSTWPPSTACSWMEGGRSSGPM